MADYTYGLSFAVFVNCAFQKIDARKAWAFFCFVFYLYMGPRSFSVEGFWRYWFNFWMLFCFCLTAWFLNFSPSPRYLKFMQDLDCPKWYTSCELKGALEDVKKEGCLFAFHPHGILTIGFGFNGMWSKQFSDLAGLTYWLIDKVLREDNPFFKVIADLHGSIESLSKNNIRKIMAKNQNVAWVPGGFEDATMMAFGKDVTAIAKRTGFIKYALEHGYSVYPIYTFHETESHYTFTGLLDIRKWLNKYGIPAVLIFGWPFFPLLPRPDIKILTVVGKPIEMPKIGEPDTEDVNKWHTLYCEKLRELFDEHKKSAGLPESASLEIC